MKNITKGIPSLVGGVNHIDLTDKIVTFEKKQDYKPSNPDVWVIKTINPGDECFYIEGGYKGTKTNLNSNSITGLFEAPKDSVFCDVGKSYNTKIQSIIQFPEGVGYLNDYCFGSCSSLGGDIIIPDGVYSLRTYCFSNSSISSIELPKTIVSLGGYCFYRCFDLQSVIYYGNSQPSGYNGNEYTWFEQVPDSLVIHVPANYSGDTFGNRTVTKDLPAV